METIQNRISAIIEEEMLSTREFESIIGCSNGVIAKCIHDSTDVCSNVIVSILEKFPQISADWLLLGKGEMLRNSDNHDSEVIISLNNYIRKLEDEVNETRKKYNKK